VAVALKVVERVRVWLVERRGVVALGGGGSVRRFDDVLLFLLVRLDGRRRLDRSCAPSLAQSRRRMPRAHVVRRRELERCAGPRRGRRRGRLRDGEGGAARGRRRLAQEGRADGLVGRRGARARCRRRGRGRGRGRRGVGRGELRAQGREARARRRAAARRGRRPAAVRRRRCCALGRRRPRQEVVLCCRCARQAREPAARRRRARRARREVARRARRRERGRLDVVAVVDVGRERREREEVVQRRAQAPAEPTLDVAVVVVRDPGDVLEPGGEGPVAVLPRRRRRRSRCELRGRWRGGRSREVAVREGREGRLGEGDLEDGRGRAGAARCARRRLRRRGRCLEGGRVEGEIGRRVREAVVVGRGAAREADERVLACVSGIERRAAVGRPQERLHGRRVEGGGSDRTRGRRGGGGPSEEVEEEEEVEVGRCRARLAVTCG